jgi:hypothetical protein
MQRTLLALDQHIAKNGMVSFASSYFAVPAYLTCELVFRNRKHDPELHGMLSDLVESL